jgi:hypothetical protein
MNCQELQDHYELFALGVAEEPERSEIRAHLGRKCEVCMPGVKRALETVAILAGTAPEAAPSRKLRGRILASVGAEQRGFGWTPLWATVAAFSLVVALYFGAKDRADLRDAARFMRVMSTQASEIDDQHRAISRLTEAFAILNGPETKEASFGGTRPSPPRGKVFVNPAQGVLLIASNLPPTEAGKLYEMWVIPKSGKPVAAGMFQSQSDGSAMHVQRGAVAIESTGAIAVTVENEAGADQPTTQPLIVAPIESSPR